MGGAGRVGGGRGGVTGSVGGLVGFPVKTAHATAHARINCFIRNLTQPFAQSSGPGPQKAASPSGSV